MPNSAPGRPDHHQVLDHQRRDRPAIAFEIVSQFHFPQHLPGDAIQRDERVLDIDFEQPVALDGEAAVHFAAAQIQRLLRRLGVVPDFFPVFRSMAQAWLDVPVTYMIPSLTSGVVSIPPGACVWKIQAGARCLMLAALMLVSSLYRQPA